MPLRGKEARTMFYSYYIVKKYVTKNSSKDCCVEKLVIAKSSPHFIVCASGCM